MSLGKKEIEEKISNLPASAVITGSTDIRSQTVELISNAQTAIFLQLSALDDPGIIDLIISRARAGVEVRILLDQWQRENSATLKNLKNSNISAHYYPAQKGQSQRVRYLIVDYQTALFYGIDLTAKGFESQSMAIKMTGNTVETMTKTFDKDWVYTTTMSLTLPEKMELPEENITYAQTPNVKQQLLRHLNNATAEIKVQLEQLSETDTVDAIILAKQKGCAVKLLLSPSSATATPNTIKRLTEAGIEIRYFNHPNGSALGYNAAVFDNKTLVMTSSPWTYTAFVQNHEASVSIPSAAVVEKFNSMFEQDWNAAMLP